jgi:scyllo-inositol 2-dehydrogenase (NADP+)
MRALQAGKHVVVDKPFTTTVDEAATLASLAKEKNLILSVFQNRRWDADFLTVRQLISTEKLGEIVSFHSSFDRYRPEVKQRWREQNIPGGGLWYDIGSHLVDQVVSLFGAPSTVYADFAMQRPSATAIDYFHVLLNYEKMLVILEAGSLVSSDTARFAIHGTAGSFIKYGKDVQESDLKKGINIKESLWGVDPEQGSFFQWQKESLTTELITNIPGDYAYYYEAIYQAILNGAPNPVTLDDALIVMNVIELAIKSAESGQRLKFDKFASFDRKAYK